MLYPAICIKCEHGLQRSFMLTVLLRKATVLSKAKYENLTKLKLRTVLGRLYLKFAE